MADNTSKSSPEITNPDDSTADPIADNTAGDITGSEVREKEVGGREGPDPTRYGDWEKNGRCIDF